MSENKGSLMFRENKPTLLSGITLELDLYQLE